MGTSQFSGQFLSNPDFFDGAAQETRDGRTNQRPDLYKLILELSNQLITADKEAPDGAAATATAERPVWLLGNFTKSILGVFFVPAAALVADPANNATLIIQARNADGTLDSVVAQMTTSAAPTGTGSWTAFKPVPIALNNGTTVISPGNAFLDIFAGQSLTWQITKGGTGVVVPAGKLVIAVA